MPKSKPTQSYLIAFLAAGFTAVALNSNAFTLGRAQCDLKVRGGASITLSSRLIREPSMSNRQVEPIDANGQLKPGFFRYRDRAMAIEYGYKACTAQESALAADPGFVPGSVRCEVKILSLSPEGSQGILESMLPDTFGDQDEIITYSAAIHFSSRHPALTRVELAQARLAKLNTCLSNERDTYQFQRLTEQKYELERELELAASSGE